LFSWKRKSSFASRTQPTPAASPKPEPAHASGTTKQEPSAPAKSKPDQAKDEKKPPAAKDGKLTAQHFAIGDKITTKSGKTGTVTPIHGKAGYLFIHNAEQGKTYHVSWASVTKVSGRDAADVVAKQAARSGKGPGYSEPAEGPAVPALKSHGWNPSKKDSTGAVAFTHPKMGNTVHAHADGTLINANSGTKVKPGEAAQYLEGFHASPKQTEGAEKQTQG
jgi:hypothetical protein